MRIVGGRLKGRALHGPKSDAIRPTSDRLRESRVSFGKTATSDDIIEWNKPAVYSCRAPIETNGRDRVVSAGVVTATDANSGFEWKSDATV